MSIANGRPTDLGFQSLRIIGNGRRVLRTGKKAIANLLSGCDLQGYMAGFLQG